MNQPKPVCGTCSGARQVAAGTHGTCDGPAYVTCPHCNGTGFEPAPQAAEE